jgi:hypothetical protein
MRDKMMDDNRNSLDLSTDVQSAFDNEYGPVGLTYDDVRMLSRITLGATLIAAEQALGRLRRYDRSVQSVPGQLVPDDDLRNESTVSLVRYLAVGVLTHGQRWAIRSAQNGLMLSVATAQWAVERLDSLTNRWFMRPLRAPVESRVRRLGDRVTDYMRTGKREEQQGRLLVNEAAADIIDELVVYISENPEVASLVREIVGGQGASMASVVVDQSRQVSAAADTAAERVVRRLLRLTPRKDLPSSPLAGHAQTMYELDAGPEGEDSNDK